MRDDGRGRETGWMWLSRLLLVVGTTVLMLVLVELCTGRPSTAKALTVRTSPVDARTAGVEPAAGATPVASTGTTSAGTGAVIRGRRVRVGRAGPRCYAPQ